MFNILDNEGLIEQCKKQNRNAQKILYDQHFNRMMAICMRYLRNEEDASEVLNNAFLKVFSKISQYKSEGSLEGWVKRIVINCSIDFVRSNKTYREKFLHTNEFALYVPPDADDPAQEVFPLDMMNLSTGQIFEMVKELPPATRVVFNLYVIDQFTHRQIARNLKISEGTSKWHLSNARKMLKQKINQGIKTKNTESSHG
ncbi:MAG: RNA polymerase sigma factor [Chitinophagales bacterium]